MAEQPLTKRRAVPLRRETRADFLHRHTTAYRHAEQAVEFFSVLELAISVSQIEPGSWTRSVMEARQRRKGKSFLFRGDRRAWAGVLHQDLCLCLPLGLVGRLLVDEYSL